MVQSVELLLDSQADQEIRLQWLMLEQAGLPSQAGHRGASNRPHITLAVAESITEAAESSMAEALELLPLRFSIGSLTCFGRRRYILVRQVVPTEGLLAFQRRIANHLDVDDPISARNAPGAWTPHVTLAHGLSAAQVGAALEILDGPADLGCLADVVRRWDSEDKSEWNLS